MALSSANRYAGCFIPPGDTMTSKDFKANLVALALSQAQFARRLDVRPSTVSDWVNGNAPVPGYAAYVLKLLDGIAALRRVAG
jgi:DNA-binding transcriptional regulator YiaG